MDPSVSDVSVPSISKKAIFLFIYSSILAASKQPASDHPGEQLPVFFLGKNDVVKLHVKALTVIPVHR